MHVWLVGDFSANLDEGYKNTSHYLADALGRHIKVSKVNAKNLNQWQLLRQIRVDQPDIVHVIAQPTVASLVATKALSVARLGIPTVVSALRPDRFLGGGLPNRVARLGIRTLRPDATLVPSRSSEARFEALGFRTFQLSNGVDTNRFRLVAPERKQQLRARYGLDPSRPIVLHVGHLAEQRNLLALADLPPAGFDVLIAGSLYMGVNTALIERLEQAGLRLLKGYQSDIETVYALADCYVFPVAPGDSVAVPLSVLEAMASGLPVVSTPFPGLLELFAESPALRYVGVGESFLPRVREVLSAAQGSLNRAAVHGHSWEAVADRLLGIYEELNR